MYGYKIRLEGTPEIMWACETETENYEWHNTHSCDLLEFGISSGKELKTIINGKEHNFYNFNNFGCVIGGDERHSFAPEGMSVSTLSVAASFLNIEAECCELCEADIMDTDYILLPAVTGSLPDGDLAKIDSLLHRIIKEHTKKGLAARVMCSALFLELLSFADGVTRQLLSGIHDDMINYYVKKVEYIMSRHYAEKLTEADMAKTLGITPVYLSWVYKKATGISLTKRLLHIRMSEAKRLLSDPNIPTHRVAALCGFCDESYFRKKFKAHTGLSIREYRLIKRGLTLYHDEPIKENYPDFKE